MPTADLDAYVPTDLPEWSDERLAAALANVITAGDEANREVIRLNRAYHALTAEQARRNRADYEAGR